MVSLLLSMSCTLEQKAKQLNSALPVHLSDKDIEGNPGFVALLECLSKHIHRNGATLSVQKDLEQVQSDLKQEKAKWLRNHILHSELRELILDNQLTKGADSQFYEAVNEMLTLAEIGDYLHCNPDPSSDVTLLGLTKEDIDLSNHHKQRKQSIEQKLIPEIETRLRKRCEGLASFHCDCTQVRSDLPGNEETTFVDASQLPSILAAGQQKLEESKQSVTDLQADISRHIKDCTSLLMDSLKIFEMIITKYKFEKQSQYDTVTCQRLILKCEVISARVKLIQLELMCDTYYSDTVEALKKIKQELEKTKHKTEEDIMTTKQTLKVYEGISGEFEQLVEEYARVKSEIDSNRWAIRNMTKKSPEKDDGAG